MLGGCQHPGEQPQNRGSCPGAPPFPGVPFPRGPLLFCTYRAKVVSCGVSSQGSAYRSLPQMVQSELQAAFIPTASTDTRFGSLEALHLLGICFSSTMEEMDFPRNDI